MRNWRSTVNKCHKKSTISQMTCGDCVCVRSRASIHVCVCVLVLCLCAQTSLSLSLSLLYEPVLGFFIQRFMLLLRVLTIIMIRVVYSFCLFKYGPTNKKKELCHNLQATCVDMKRNRYYRLLLLLLLRSSYGCSLLQNKIYVWMKLPFFVRFSKMDFLPFGFRLFLSGLISRFKSILMK